MGKITLVTGGVRSGKSLLGEKLAETYNSKIYIATGEAKDDEMISRIAMHKKRRDHSWTTLEIPIEISKAVESFDNEAFVLIDCVGFWVTNNLLVNEEENLLNENLFFDQMHLKTNALIDILLTRKGESVLVSNEVGFGLVPPYKLGRIFRDTMGVVNSLLSASAKDVYLCAAGLPLKIKKDGVNQLA